MAKRNATTMSAAYVEGLRQHNVHLQKINAELLEALQTLVDAMTGSNEGGFEAQIADAQAAIFKATKSG